MEAAKATATEPAYDPGKVTLEETIDQTMTGTCNMLPVGEVNKHHKVYEDRLEGSARKTRHPATNNSVHFSGWRS